MVTLPLVMPGCQLQGKEPVNPDKKDITVRDLYRAARSQRKILLVDGWQNPDLGKKLRDLITSTYTDNWELMVKDYSQVTEEEVSSTPTMLIGIPGQNPLLDKLIKQLPVTIEKDQLLLDQRTFDANTHSIVLSYHPNPLNVRMPIGLFASSNEELVWELTASRISGFLRGNWGYEVLKGKQRVLLGNFSQQPQNRWEFDDTQQIVLSGKLAHQWNSGKFDFYSYDETMGPEQMQSVVAACDAAYRRIEEFCNSDHWENIEYYLYPSTEIKGLMTGNTDQSHLVLDHNQIHTAFDDHFSDRYYGKENQLIVRSILGNPSFEALETGLSVYFTAHWEKYGYLYWAHHLISGGNYLTVGQLLDREEFNHASSLFIEALSASLVHFLIEKWGREEFLNKYRQWDLRPHEMDSLNAEWVPWVNSLVYESAQNEKGELPFLKGFNFTHEGYQIFNGYGSDLSEKSLEQLRKIGSNTVAIVPYGWMSNPNQASRFRFSSRAGSENDEGIIHAICKAKRQKFITVLKPHVWISNSWPGDVEMRSEEDWDKFFEYYTRWISHYALLAEMYGVDMLCIGVEFSKTTLLQEERWEHLIEKLRGIYSGNLIYAANWGDEFEKIGIWEHLDFIGLNCYYPLSNKDATTKKELKKGFSKVLDKVERVKSRYHKPVLFTEIGFRSVQSPWQQPHEEAGIKDFNEDHQAMAYDAVFEALWNRPVIDGILWWKWPTNHQLRFQTDRRFVPNGKQAEQVVRKWFVDKLE